MSIRLIPLSNEHIPIALSLISASGEWSPRSQVFTDPIEILTKPFSHWMVALIKDEVIGVVGFHNISWPDGIAEIFLGIVEKWRGKGLAQTLTDTQIAFGFLDMGFRKLVMTCLDGSPSAKIATKMGLKPEGIFPNARLKRGKYHTSLAFGLERSNYVK